MFDFNQMFPIFNNQKIQPISGKGEGHGVIPQDGKIVTCPTCNGAGKEKQQ